MTLPLIAITGARLSIPEQDGELGPHFTGVCTQYSDGVLRAGGAPVIIPRTADGNAIRSIMEMVDGVLFPGGGDIGSLTYDTEPHPASKGQDSVRDELELLAAKIAIGRQMPILGICRGIQLLNVVLGGTLIQDIPTQTGNSIMHNADPAAPYLAHTVDIDPVSTLGKLLGVSSMSVNSYHHQAVDRLGVGLRVSARSKDGMIEAAEFVDGNPLLAVQYHPEELADTDERFQLYFDWLVEQAIVYKNTGSGNEENVIFDIAAG